MILISFSSFFLFLASYCNLNIKTAWKCLLLTESIHYKRQKLFFQIDFGFPVVKAHLALLIQRNIIYIMP